MTINKRTLWNLLRKPFNIEQTYDQPLDLDLLL